MQFVLGLPILVALDHNLRQLQDDCLRELTMHSGRLQVYDSDLGGLELSVYDSPSAHGLVGRHWSHPGHSRQYRLLTVAVDGRAYVNRFVAEHRAHKQVEELAVSIGIEELEMQASGLLLLANLLRPGSISTDRELLFAMKSSLLYRLLCTQSTCTMLLRRQQLQAGHHSMSYPFSTLGCGWRGPPPFQTG
jgi:hypothetical protein